MEIALPVFTPLTIVAGRMVVAATMLNIVVWQMRSRYVQAHNQITLLTWIQCAGLSLLSNLIPFGLVVWGQQYISASLASILVAAAPVFTVVLATLWKQEKVTLARSLGVTLGFAGVVVLVGPSVLRGFSLRGAGELAILGAALSYAFAGFAGQRFSHLPPLLISRMTVTMGTLMVLPVALSRRPITAEISLTATLAVIALGVFSTGLAYIIFYRLLSEAGVLNTSLVSFLVPITAVILGTVVLQERVNGAQLLGMGFILSGLAVLDGRLANKMKMFS